MKPGLTKRPSVKPFCVTSDPRPLPFKRSDTGYYATELTLRGYGKLRRTSLFTKKKSEAVLLENAIKQTHRLALVDPRRLQLLDALQGQGPGTSGDITPEHLLLAVRHPGGAEEGIDRLLRSLDDPPLAKYVEYYLSGEHSQRVTREDRIALPNLVRYAEAEHGEGCPISTLADPDAVQRLLKAVWKGEEKRKNSVIRYEKRALSKLLTLRYGRAERDRIMKDVTFTETDDRRRLRESVVTAAAIGRLCDELRAGYYSEGDEAAPLYVRIAVATGAEVGPLSRTQNKDYNAPAGEIYLTGTKRVKDGKGRDRPILLPPQIAAEVAKYHREDQPEADLFPLPKSRFDTMFQKARKRAGLMKAVLDGKGNPTPLRPHDLRQVFAAVAERAGVSRTAISVAGLGHTSLEMTDRYLLRETTISREQLAAIASKFGW